MRCRVLIGMATLAAALGVLPVRAFDPGQIEDLAIDGVAAELVTGLDMATFATEYAQYAGGNPNVTCGYGPVAAQGVPQRNVESVGAVFARDIGYGSAVCASLANQPYAMRLRITFQQYNRALNRFESIAGTSDDCFPDARHSGVAIIASCVNDHPYTYNHSSVNKWHRAKFHLLDPVFDPPIPATVSRPFLLGNGDRPPGCTSPQPPICG